MNMLEAFRRHLEIGDGRNDVALNLCLLAWDTFTCPLADVLFDIWPYEFVSYCLPGSLDTRMAQAMNDVENPTPV